MILALQLCMLIQKKICVILLFSTFFLITKNGLAAKVEPSLGKILDAVIRNEKLTSSELDTWERKIKLSAWLPTLYAGYDHQLKQAQSVSVADTVSVSGGIVTVGPEDTDIDYDNNSGQIFRIRAVWNLDKVVFNDDLFTLASQRRDTLALRLTLSDKVMKYYEARLNLKKQYHELGGSRNIKSRLIAAKYNQITEWLDHMSGYKYTDNFTRIILSGGK